MKQRGFAAPFAEPWQPSRVESPEESVLKLTTRGNSRAKSRTRPLPVFFLAVTTSFPKSEEVESLAGTPVESSSDRVMESMSSLPNLPPPRNLGAGAERFSPVWSLVKSSTASAGVRVPLAFLVKVTGLAGEPFGPLPAKLTRQWRSSPSRLETEAPSWTRSCKLVATLLPWLIRSKMFTRTMDSPPINPAATITPIREKPERPSRDVSWGGVRQKVVFRGAHPSSMTPFGERGKAFVPFP